MYKERDGGGEETEEESEIKRCTLLRKTFGIIVKLMADPEVRGRSAALQRFLHRLSVQPAPTE